MLLKQTGVLGRCVVSSGEAHGGTHVFINRVRIAFRLLESVLLRREGHSMVGGGPGGCPGGGDSLGRVA